ncbi:MAG TPA: cadherin-like domain-containing protein, partial [Acidimicrobiales bacterium]
MSRLVALVLGALATAALAASFAVSAPPSIEGAQPAAATDGYLLAAIDGGVFAFGDTPFAGSLGAMPLAAPIVDGTLSPTARGYLLFGRDGGVFTFGDATFHGSAAGAGSRPIVAGDVTPTGNGYILVDSVGAVFRFGDAPSLGSMAGTPLSAPIVDISITPGNDGYTIAGADGGVFTFGAAPFHGSLGATPLNKPIKAFMSAVGSPGYALVAEDGGVFTRGGFAFNGSLGGTKLNRPIVDAAATPSGAGYLMAGADGGVFAFGDAVFRGSRAGRPAGPPIVAIMAPENSPPVAVDDAFNAVEDTLLSINAASGVVANDTDAEGDPLTVSVVTTTTNGTLALGSDGSFTYTPGLNFNGSDTFTYRVTDGIDTDTGSVTITVAPVNDAPVAVNDSSTTSEAAPVGISVLPNDSDVDGDSLSVSAVDLTGTAGNATHDGTTITYTPPAAANALAAGETLVDSFTYTVSDGAGGTDMATVTVTVTGQNDAPDAVADAAGANENGPAVGVDVLGNDTDPDTTDTLTVTAINETGTTGDVTLTAGAVTYNPNGAFEALDTGETAQT